MVSTKSSRKWVCSRTLFSFSQRSVSVEWNLNWYLFLQPLSLSEVPLILIIQGFLLGHLFDFIDFHFCCLQEFQNRSPRLQYHPFSLSWLKFWPNSLSRTKMERARMFEEILPLQIFQIQTFTFPKFAGLLDRKHQRMTWIALTAWPQICHRSLAAIIKKYFILTIIDWLVSTYLGDS